MYWVATRNAVVSFPRWRSLALLLHSPPRRYSSFNPSPVVFGQFGRFYCFKDRKVPKGSAKATKKLKALNNILDEKGLSNILWWKERMQACRKPSTVQLVKRLEYSNLLGLDVNLKSGSLKEGTLNSEILQFKSKFPREVLLCRVGDFYEALGIDACILVEYAGLNPFGGLRSDSIPRAGCPVVNLQQTLDDLTRNGYSVCIVDEVQGPTQARSRKSRFISGHAHPGSPYVFGLVGVDHDLDFPEPMPVIGISRSARGYCINLVLETMKTYSSEDGLTEEALVTKLRTCRHHHLFLHASLRHNSSAYLQAGSDQESVMQGRNGTYPTASWTVEIVSNSGSKRIIRLKSCYDKYLTASDLPLMLGWTGQKVFQTLPKYLGPSVEWEVDAISGHKVRLKNLSRNSFLKPMVVFVSLVVKYYIV